MEGFSFKVLVMGVSRSFPSKKETVARDGWSPTEVWIFQVSVCPSSFVTSSETDFSGSGLGQAMVTVR